MAVSNCNKEVATRLYRMLAISELEADRVKSDHASFAKLGLLTQQAQLLQRQAPRNSRCSVPVVMAPTVRATMPLAHRI